MGHPDEEIVRRGYDAFSRGDMQTLRELFDPDVVWHTPGRSQLAGDHRGVDAVLGFFGRTMELTGGTFRVEVHDVVANDEHVVGLHEVIAEREGKTLRDRNVLCSMSTTAGPARFGSSGRTSTPPTRSSARAPFDVRPRSLSSRRRSRDVPRAGR
jgi:ketosteroid isomerase-like protein